MSRSIFWVLSEVDYHLTYRHPQNGLPVVLVFSTKRRSDRFNLENPQNNTIAKGVPEEDVTLMMRQWAYGGVEYFTLDPEGTQDKWVPEPVSRFREVLPELVEGSALEEATRQAEDARRKAEQNAQEVTDLQRELQARLHPPRPEPPPAPRPWYEAHGLD